MHFLFGMTENSMNAIRGKRVETCVAVIKYISTYAGTYYRMGNVTEVDAGERKSPVGEPVVMVILKDIIKCATATFKTMEPRVVVCPGVGDKLEQLVV